MRIMPHPLTKTASTQPSRYRRKVFALSDFMGPKYSQPEYFTLLLSMFYCMCRWNSFLGTGILVRANSKFGIDNFLYVLDPPQSFEAYNSF